MGKYKLLYCFICRTKLSMLKYLYIKHFIVRKTELKMQNIKAAGLVTEYNPFHNGHLYHLQKSLEITNADIAIAVMSGNFVQRGIPAITDKYKRCRAAVDSGVNLVVELPLFYAVSSAEIFAAGAVATLNALNASFISFGCENADIQMLKKIAITLVNEPDEYKKHLKKALTCGDSFPTARAKALSGFFKSDNISRLISSPNNILAIEYIKEIIKSESAVTPVALTRKISGYHDIEIHENIASASAIRKILHDSGIHKNNDSRCKNIKELQNVMPEAMYNILSSESQNNTLIYADDFSSMLNYKISNIFYIAKYNKNACIETLCAYHDINKDLACRIYSSFTGCDSFNGFIEKIKTRGFTYSRLSRCLMHIILDIKKENISQYESLPYIRILGFDKKGREYLSQIKKTCPVPIITKAADYKNLLTNDIHAASLYNQIVYTKSGIINKDEFRQPLYIK